MPTKKPRGRCRKCKKRLVVERLILEYTKRHSNIPVYVCPDCQVEGVQKKNAGINKVDTGLKFFNEVVKWIDNGTDLAWLSRFVKNASVIGDDLKQNLLDRIALKRSSSILTCQLPLSKTGV